MATTTITIPQDFTASLQQLMQTMQKLSAFTNKLKQANVTTPSTVQVKVNADALQQNFHRVHRNVESFGSLLSSSVTKLISTLGSAARGLVSGLSIESVIISPVTAALGVASFGLIPTALATTTGIFRWLQGKVMELAGAMNKDRLTAMATGTTVGGVRAIKSAFADVPNIESFIQFMNVLQYDVSNRTASTIRALLGVKAQKDSFQVTMQTMLSLQMFLQKMKLTEALITAQQQFPDLPPDFIRYLYALPRAELQEKIQRATRLRPQFEAPPKTQRALIDIMTAFQTMWNSIETTLGRKFAQSGIVESVTKISKLMPGIMDIILHLPITQDAMKGVQNGLEWLANWLRDTDTIRKIGSVIAGIIDAFEQGIMALAELTHDDQLKEEIGRRRMRRQLGYYAIPGADIPKGVYATKPTFLWGAPGIQFRPGIGPGATGYPPLKEGIRPASPEHVGPGGGRDPSVRETPVPQGPSFRSNVPRQVNIPGTPGLMPRGGIRRTRNQEAMERARKQAPMPGGPDPRAPGGRGQPSGPQPEQPSTSAAPSGNWDNYLAGLSYLETNQNPNEGNRTSSAKGAFQFLDGTAREAMRLGIPNPQRGTYQEQAAATRQYIERTNPAAARAIERGDYATADRLLRGTWPSLPGGSQAQRGSRYTTRDEILRGGGPRPPGEEGRPPAPTRTTPTPTTTQQPPVLTGGGGPGIQGLPGTPSGPTVRAPSAPGDIGATPGQGDRPYYYGGTVEMDGETYHFGTGGGGRGSLPYGTFVLDPGGVGPLGRTQLGAVAGITDTGKGNEVMDPKIGTRYGVEVHPSSSADLDRLYTAGCFAVPRKEWPAFKQKFLDMAKQSKTGKLYLTVTPTERGKALARITQAPTGPSDQTRQLTPEQQALLERNAISPSAAGVRGRIDDPTARTDPRMAKAADPVTAAMRDPNQAARAANAAPTAANAAPGGVASPFPGVSNFRIVGGNRYGDARSGGYRAHSGNDLHGGPDGSPVHSMTGGTVLYNNKNQGYGWNIVIKGDDGVIRRYATHGPTERLRPGDRVEQGQRIGTIGQGHVHYEEVPPEIDGRPNPVYRQFEDNARTNTFTSTSNQRGTVDPSGPQGTLQNIGRPTQPAPAVGSNPTDGRQKTMLFLHGMQSRYSQGGVTKTPAQVEADARRYAESKGYKLEVIPVSGDNPRQQLEAARARIKQGGVDAVTGFSAGAYNVDHLRTEFPNLEYAKAGGREGARDIDPNRPHMEQVAALADRAEKQKQAEGTTAKDSPHPPRPEDSKPREPAKKATPADEAARDPGKAKQADTSDKSKSKIKISENNSPSPREATHSGDGSFDRGIKVDNRSNMNVRAVEHQEGAYPL